MANPTTNYGFVLPTSTDLVTDLPADFDVALQGVDTRLKALQPGTTLGDIAYSSATANTNTRLGIGSTNQVLTVSGGVPTWATPAGGGAYTLLSTTTLSGTSTTISSISGSYTDLKVVIYGVNVNAAGSYFKCSLNGDLTSNFGNMFAPTATGASQTYYSIGADTVWLAYNNPMLNASTVNGFEINISNYSNTSTIKAVNSVSSFITSGTSRRFESSDSYYINTAAVTSLVFAGNTFNGGTVLVYGVK